MTHNPASTELPHDLLEAFRATEYRVAGTPGKLVLRVDRFEPGLAALMRRNGCASVAYLTACNPRSRLRDEDWNRRAQARLKARLDAARWPWLDGLGIAPGGDHPGEASVLVLGIDQAQAEALGHEFEQDAIVVAGPEATPRLVLLR